MKLHHVGIVMNELDRAERFLETFGLQEAYREYVPQYQALCIFAEMEGCRIELVVPSGGVLQAFNNGKGGLHHIALWVKDVAQAREDYERRGLLFLEEKAVKGAGPILVNFLRPRFGQGILVEFVETMDTKLTEKGSEPDGTLS